MEGDDGLRTLECLRGRLLAERQASRTAKEDAEIMGNKLIELKNKLKEETKLRNKAEKRLKSLRKKLESSEKSSAVSSVSSSSSSSTNNKDPEDSAASKSQISIPEEITKNVGENASDSDTTTSMKSLEISFSEETSSSPRTTTSTKSDAKDSSHEKSSGKSSSSLDDPSSSSLKASTMEIGMNGRNVNDEEEEDHVDNSLALVPLKLPETKLGPEQIKIVSKSIGEVLDTLRHARERIQSSMERRQMISVGPS